MISSPYIIMDLKQYLLDKKAYLKPILDEVEPREINLEPNRNIITAIIGPRRAGKTYLFYSFIKERKLKDEEYLIINFEDAGISDLSEEEVLKCTLYHQELYGAQPKYLFFDEVQAFDGWERVVYTLYERKLYSIVLTGSSSKLLSREIATQLRGRSMPVLVLPFSFKELIGIKGVQYTEGKVDSMTASAIKNLLREYLQNGGFPDVVLHNVQPADFFREYVDVLLFKDVVEREKIRNIEAAKFMIKAVAASFSKEFSINKNYLLLKSNGAGIGKKTLYSYLSYFEDAFFSFVVQKFDFSIKKSALSSKKVYLCDTGISSYFSQAKDIGRLMENAVFVELMRKNSPHRSFNIYYWKDSNGSEVDFVIKDGSGVRELLQVTYASSKEEIEERELSALRKAKKALRCSKAKIITWDFEGEINKYGIRVECTPLWKWLLSSHEI